MKLEEEYRKDLKSKFFLSETQLDLVCQGFKDGYNRAEEEYKKLFLQLEQNIRDLADPSARYNIDDLAEDWEVEL